MRLYVGNLPFSATEEDLRSLFSQHGTVEDVHVVTDRQTGSPRGFGFVEMDDTGGEAAISALNGADMNGRNLKVDKAQPRR
ncbi:MAG: RNA-binding protein [Candidatus Eisenbacteria bacterium]|nr:RNA-binding protein [Candidatus Eisenbacteria bacterium]